MKCIGLYSTNIDVRLPGKQISDAHMMTSAGGLQTVAAFAPLDTVVSSGANRKNYSGSCGITMVPNQTQVISIL